MDSDDTTIFNKLTQIYYSLSIEDRLLNNDYIVAQLIGEYMKHTDHPEIEENIANIIMEFITEHQLYHHTTFGLLERTLQTFYYMEKPTLYIHCIQEITGMIIDQYPDMLSLLQDHCTAFYNHPTKSSVYKLQTIIPYLPDECTYHILFESVGRNAEHIIFFILHYIGELKWIDKNMNHYIVESPYKHRYKNTVENLAPYIQKYKKIQELLNDVMYKDEVSIVATFLYGKRDT